MPDLTLTFNNKWTGAVTARVYYTPKEGENAGQAVAATGDLYVPKGKTVAAVTVPDAADTTKPYTVMAWWGIPGAQGSALVLNAAFAFSAPKQTICLGGYSTGARVLGGVFVAIVVVLLILFLVWAASPPASSSSFSSAAAASDAEGYGLASPTSPAVSMYRFV